MFVKVCGITKPSQAANLSELNVSYVGCIHFEGSPRHNSLEELKTLASASTQKILVTVDLTIEETKKAAKALGTKILQLHGNESPEHCHKLRNEGYKIIKAISVYSKADFNETAKYEGFVDQFLFDTKGENKGGNGFKFDWTMLQEYQLETPFILSGGISIQDAESIRKLNHSKLSGIDINSRFEVVPGIKNITLIKEFLNQINHEQLV